MAQKVPLRSLPNTARSLTLYNVCSVHRGMFSTSGGVQYIGGYHEYIGGYHEYIGGDTMSTSEGYHEYILGCSVHRRDT